MNDYDVLPNDVKQAAQNYLKEAENFKAILKDARRKVLLRKAINKLGIAVFIISITFLIIYLFT